MPELRSDINSEKDNETSASDIVEVLRKYKQPVPIDFVATKLRYNPRLVRSKIEDLQEVQLVTITDDNVKLKDD
jgi:hypothetical protein